MSKPIRWNKKDDYKTPMEAVEILLPYIPKFYKNPLFGIWEPTDPGDSKITEFFKKVRFPVFPTHIDKGIDFLTTYIHPNRLVITNPPYSIKDLFIERILKEKIAAFLLVPIDTLAGINRVSLYLKYKPTLGVLIPDKRINFIEGKGSPAFHSVWLGINVPDFEGIYFTKLNIRKEK